MRISNSITNSKDTDWQVIRLSHGKNEPLDFTMQLYGKVKDAEYVFRDFNNFIAYFEKVNRDGADELFSLFKQISEANGIFGFSKNSQETVKAAVRRMYQILTPNAVLMWLSNFDDKIELPIVPIDKSNDYSPDQTYNLQEYKELLALSILIKPMILVWGDFGVKSKTLPAAAIEEQCLSFLKGTVIEETDAFSRHRVFVEALTEDQITTAGVLEGISSSSLPRKTFACAVVNKLCQIRSSHKGEDVGNQVINIVANMHRYVKSIIASLNKTGTNTVTKTFKEKGTDEDNTSNAECYNIREDIPEVTKAFFDSYAKDLTKLAISAKHDINKSNVLELAKYNHRTNITPVEVQYKMVGIILADQIGVRSIQHTIRDSALNAFAVAQEILFEMGHPNLAALLTATIMRDDERNLMRPTQKILKEQIKSAQLELLNEFYPYRLKSKGSRIPYKNPAVIAIEEIANRFAAYVWELHLPDKFLPEVTLTRHLSGGYVVRDNFRYELGEFIIKINENKGK